jgi:hypothetical protein
MVTAQETPAYAIVPGNCLEILSSRTRAMIQQRADRALAEIAARPAPETAQEEESTPA